MIKRVIVAGSRDYRDYDEARAFIDESIADIREKHTLVFVSGGCSGADRLGEMYAEENGYTVERYPAEWEKYGKAAGHIRNRKMVEKSDFVICFWDGRSSGTKSLIGYALKKRTVKFSLYIIK